MSTSPWGSERESVCVTDLSQLLLLAIRGFVFCFYLRNLFFQAVDLGVLFCERLQGTLAS
jgi:hypothetical protein